MTQELDKLPHGIKGIMVLRPRGEEPFLLLMMALLGLVLVILGVLIGVHFWKQRRQRKKKKDLAMGEELPTEVYSYESLKSQLSLLALSPAPSEEEKRQTLGRMAWIIRKAVSLRMGSSPELTTADVAAYFVEETSLAPSHKEEILHFLQKMDQLNYRDLSASGFSVEEFYTFKEQALSYLEHLKILTINQPIGGNFL